MHSEKLSQLCKDVGNITQLEERLRQNRTVKQFHRFVTLFFKLIMSNESFILYSEFSIFSSNFYFILHQVVFGGTYCTVQAYANSVYHNMYLLEVQQIIFYYSTVDTRCVHYVLYHHLQRNVSSFLQPFLASGTK